MSTISLEHVRLTNRLRAFKRETYGAAAEAFDRLRSEGGVDLDQAADLLCLIAATRVVAHQREINHERLLEYLANGMSLDVPGLPGPLGPVSEGDQAFEHLSAQIDRVAQASLEAHRHQPFAASLTTWVEAQRCRYRFKAWLLTHPTCTMS